MTYTALVKRAQAARKHSHSPFSHFRVGAAVLTASGKVFTGCNIEISTFALTVCAERTALLKAVSEGHRKFKALAIVSDEKAYTPPCGACRQVIMDLAGNIDIVLGIPSGPPRIMKMSDLFPYPFGARNFAKK
jgi:cytidine deaminase